MRKIKAQAINYFTGLIKQLWYGDSKGLSNQQEGLQEITDAERIELLRSYVVRKVAFGASVELQDDFSAVLIWGRPVNHILHLLLSLVTFGLWIIVWIFIAVNSGEKRRLFQIDKFGRITP